MLEWKSTLTWRWVDKDCTGDFHDMVTVMLMILVNLKVMVVVSRGEKRGKKS